MGLPVDLQEGEQMLMRVRRHWLFIRPILFALLGGWLLLSLVLVLLASVVGVVVALLLAIPMLGYAYLRSYQHRNDEWIVTNQRIVDSHKKHWFHQEISSADLVNVQDMSVVKNGFLPTVFNYGDLRCQTAGSQSLFVLKQIPDPNKILDTIDQARDASRGTKAS